MTPKEKFDKGVKDGYTHALAGGNEWNHPNVYSKGVAYGNGFFEGMRQGRYFLKYGK